MDCDIKCWECKKNCNIKLLFLLPEKFFYYQIYTSLKEIAGIYITSGLDFHQADMNFKKTVVSLIIARNLFLEKIIQDEDD